MTSETDHHDVNDGDAISESVLAPVEVTSNTRRIMCALAAATVVVMFVARILAPSDLHDQTQPKTIGYTTNIIVHGGDHWILPTMQEAEPATKPPLYNWLAVPAVKIAGAGSEFAHKLPSVVAFLVMCVIAWRVGDQMDRRATGAPGITGALAVMMMASSYVWFKLGYLARPDTVLSMWMVIGWVAATKIIEGTEYGSGDDRWSDRVRTWQTLFWVSAGLAILTKGPPGFVLPLFVITLYWVAIERYEREGRSLVGSGWYSCRAGLKASGASWGIPIMLLIPLAWLIPAYQIDPGHFYETLIREEVTDRWLGTGAEGTNHGVWDWLLTLPDMPFYLVTRFLPWSILFIGGIIDLVARPRPDRARGPESGVTNAESGPVIRLWLTSAVIYPLLVVLFFTFAAGKRSDYIASAFVPAAIFTAWGARYLGVRVAVRFPALIPIAAAVTLIALGVYEQRLSFSAENPATDRISAFLECAEPVIAQRDDWPVHMYYSGSSPLQTLMGRSQRDVGRASEASGEAWTPLREPAWIVGDAERVAELATRLEAEFTMTQRCESVPVTVAEGWPPLHLVLYELQPR